MGTEGLVIRGAWLTMLATLAAAVLAYVQMRRPPKPERRIAPESEAAEERPSVDDFVFERPARPALKGAPAELTPAVEAQVERWRARAIKRKFGSFSSMPYGYEGTTDMVKTEATRYGPFDVVAASVLTPVVAGGAEDTHEMLILTKQGELEVENAPDVIALADVTGDGRVEVVFRDVTVVSDMPNGPLVLKVADRGGAYGWRDVRIASHEGKPALVATTETTRSYEVGALGAGGYIAEESKGIVEEVTLQWNGRQLAAVSRRPLEARAQATAREQALARAIAAEEARRAPPRVACAYGCPGECARTDGGAACLTKCKAECYQE